VEINFCIEFWFLNIYLQKGEAGGAEKMKEVSSSAGSHPVNRVETEMEQVSNYNYFSSGLMVRCLLQLYTLFGHLRIVFLLCNSELSAGCLA